MGSVNYRLRFLWDLVRWLIVPSIVLRLSLGALAVHPGLLLSIPLHLAFILCWAASRGAYTRAKQAREAKSLGARTIPCVVGKWPGNVDILLKMLKAFKTAYILDVYRELFEEYQCTTLNLRILWRDSIISMDQEHVKFVLATGFQSFYRGPQQRERMEVFLGDGIFNRDDEMWKMHRSITRPFFARERISDFELFEKYCSRTLSILSSLSGSNTACDAQDIYSRLSLDSASEFLFGRNVDTLSASLPVPGEAKMGPKGSATNDSWGSFTHAFEMSQINIMTRGRIGAIWPLFELSKDKNEEHSRVIRRWLDPLVQSALEDKERRHQSGASNPVGERTFLEHLAESVDSASIIRDQLLSMLLASRDTTACVLTFVTYFLAIHPDICQRLRNEVLETCGTTKQPSFEQCRRMKYMRAVINETLRLYPPVPLNARESKPTPCVFPSSDPTYSPPSDDDSKQGLYVPGSTIFLYLPLLTHRNPALWGPDADEFDPERWLDPQRLARFTSNPMMFTPFSAGPRICVGQNYAYNQLSYFLVRLLQRFDRFSLAPEFQPEGSHPPSEWKDRKGRQQNERIWAATALTLYVKASKMFLAASRLLIKGTGRTLATPNPTHFPPPSDHVMQHFGKAALRITKNYTKGYSDTQAKVRDATSNDPWGPSGTQMNEIAQLTYNQNDFIEIMEMLDKRLNDKGKNWRHVFKSLTVLDYCLHQGSENVVIYFRDNIYIIKTLKEFQYIDEDGKDQGANVRQKAKDITNLLIDEGRLREERRSRASMRDRMIRGGAGGDEDSPPDENQSRRSRGNNGTNGLAGKRPNRDEDELRKAIEESKKSLAQERLAAEQRDLDAAIQMSKEEEEKRKRDVESSNESALFDDANQLSSPAESSHSNNPFPLIDPTPYAVGLQPQYTVQPQFTSIQPQFTSFNPYQQQAQQEAMQAEYLRQQQEFVAQQQALQQQQQQEEWLRQQQLLQMQQQQQMQMQQNLFAPQAPIQLQPTGFGNNNPFAPASPSSFSPSPQPSNNATSPSFNLPSTYEQHSTAHLSALSSSPRPSSSASSAPSHSNVGRPAVPTIRKKENENEALAALFADREGGQDTFGNVGQLRYGYTDAGKAVLQTQKTGGHNPFAKQGGGGAGSQQNEKPFFDI